MTQDCTHGQPWWAPCPSCDREYNEGMEEQGSHWLRRFGMGLLVTVFLATVSVSAVLLFL